ncbi:MAG TPA: hypothetical protein VL404_01975 [Candidatus Eisenbacteria bacterium]|nr:hypothetical protein [Candidatus Eisenbacteria bacterium]
MNDPLPACVKAGRALRLVGWAILVFGWILCFVMLGLHLKDGRFSLVLPPILTVGALFTFVAVTYIVTGVGLMHKKTWARVSGFLVAFTMLFAFPVGTLFGLYIFWCLTKGWK